MRDSHRQKLRRRLRREAAEIAARTPTQKSNFPYWGPPPAEYGADHKVRSLPFEITDLHVSEEAQSTSADANGTNTGHRTAEPREPLRGAPYIATGPTLVNDDECERAARDAATRGDIDQAARLYRALMNRRSDDLNVRYKLALLLDQSGEHEEALELLDRCISNDPANVAMRVHRGAVLVSVARYAEAECDLLEAIALDPSNADGHFTLGLVEVRRGRWSDAIPHLRRALELDSSNASAHFYLGEALNHVDDIYGALQAYQRATELHPLNPAAYYGLGIVLDRIGRPDEATQMYRRSREMAAR